MAQITLLTDEEKQHFVKRITANGTKEARCPVCQAHSDVWECSYSRIVIGDAQPIRELIVFPGIIVRCTECSFLMSFDSASLGFPSVPS